MLCASFVAAFVAVSVALPATSFRANIDSNDPRNDYVSHADAQAMPRRLATINDTMNDATKRAAAIGTSVRDAIKRLRGGSTKFYQDLITAAKIKYCDSRVSSSVDTDNPMTRFVSNSSKFAYKYDNGTCVRLLNVTERDPDATTKYNDPNYQCEVKPNCYWGPINETTDTYRLPVYSMKENVDPPLGAMTLEGANDEIVKWGRGLVVFIAPGIILAGLSFISSFFFILCRCCCNRCGGRRPKDGGYTCFQKFLPVLFFLLFAIGVVVVAAVSLLYSNTVNAAVSDMFDATTGTLTNTSTWMIKLTEPLVKVSDKVTDTAANVQTQLTGTDLIESGIAGLTAKLDNFATDSADRKLPAGCLQSDPYCTPCTVCTTISQQVSAASQEIHTNADDGISQLHDAKDNINKLLVEAASGVQDMVESAVDTASVLVDTVNSTRDKVDDIQGKYDKQKQIQQFAVLAPFVFALVTIAIGFIGVLFGITPLKCLANIIHLAYLIGFLALILTFIFSSIFLAVSVLLGDACEITLIFTEDWSAVFGDQADPINACFQNQSILDALNLTSSLEFARGGIKFPDSTLDLQSMLNFDLLDQMATDIGATDESTFVSTARLTQTLVDLNALTVRTHLTCSVTDIYNATNVFTPWNVDQEPRTPLTEAEDAYVLRVYTAMESTPDCNEADDGAAFTCTAANPCTYGSKVTEAYIPAWKLHAVKQDATAFIAELKQNMTVVTTYKTDFVNQATTLETSLTAIKTDLESSLFKYVDEFEAGTRCTFLADGFFQFYDAFCGDLMPALTMISLMIFLAAVFLIPVTITLIIAVKRLKARGNGAHVLDNEMKFK